MTTKEKKPSAFMKPVHVTPELAQIVGSSEITRTQITQKVWDYIKRHRLQDQKNKRVINPDQLLAKVLGSTQPIDMFELTRLISKHIREPNKEPAGKDHAHSHNR